METAGKVRVRTTRASGDLLTAEGVPGDDNEGSKFISQIRSTHEYGSEHLPSASERIPRLRGMTFWTSSSLNSGPDENALRSHDL